MGTEQDQNEKNEHPSAEPEVQPQGGGEVGASQPNQSLWDAGKAGEPLKPPPDAVPGKPPPSDQE